MIVVINSLGGLVNIQDEDLFQGSTKLNKIDLVAPFADNVVWKANFEMPDGTIRPDNLDGYLFQPSMKIVDNFNVWKLPITFPITQDYGIVTVQLRGYIGETVVCTTSIKLPIQKGVPYASNFEELGDKDQLLQMISDLRALANSKADKVNYTFKTAENITNETVGIYFVYDDETEQYVSKTLPQEYVEGTQYYEVLNTGRIVNVDGELSFAFIDNATNQSMVLKIEKDKATLNGKQIATAEDLSATNIAYDNTNSKLEADNVQSAIDEVNNKAEGIANNSIKIGDDKDNFSTKGAIVGPNSVSSVAIGNGAEVRLGGSVAILGKTYDFSPVAIGNSSEAGGESVAIGVSAKANGQKAIAIGSGARADAYSVQIGSGYNTEANTLKFKNFTIVDSTGKLKTNTGSVNSPVMEIVATEKYVNELINKFSNGVTFVFVDVLPAENINLSAIYFVKINNGAGNNYYEEYVYIENRWELIGTTQINLENYYDKETVDSLLLTTHKQILLGADGVIEENVYNFTVESPDSYIEYRTNGTKFLVDLHLPVVGELDTTKEVAITFGNTTYYVYNILKGQEHSTIGDLRQVDKYHNQTGYRFIAEMTFFENAEITGFAIIPTISMSDVLSLTSDEMDNYMAEGGLTQGQLAICNKVITNGYTEGGLYRFDITYPDTYTWTALSSGVSQEDFDKLVNNEIQIKTSNGGFKAGGASKALNSSIAIGTSASADMSGIAIGKGTKAYSSADIAIGSDAYAYAVQGIAIGNSAKVKASNAIQLGAGENTEERSLQILDDNIYDANTHTLKVQNIELNGVDLATKLADAGGAIPLTEEQYQELITNGSVVVDGKTITYNDKGLYVTPDTIEERVETLEANAGSGKKYQHNICFAFTGDYRKVTFNFINSTPEAYTNTFDVAKALNILGFNGGDNNNKRLTCNGAGYWYNNTLFSIYNQVYSPNDTWLTFAGYKISITDGSLTPDTDGVAFTVKQTVSDTVIEL